MLVALGRMTEVRFVPSGGAGVLRWKLRAAPLLAYDVRGKLVVLYTPRTVRAATAHEIAEYKETHWGQSGHARVSAAERAGPPWRTLGPALSVTYTTAKADSELKDWVHEFGEGGPKKWTPPTLIQHRCASRRCAGEWRLAFRGGSYRVTERGIVG